MRRRILGPALLGLAALTVPARADLLAYEPFDYEPAGVDLNGLAGGFGFAGPWQPGGFNASISDHLEIAGGSLGFDDLATDGDRATSAAQTAISGLTRPLQQPLGDAGTTRYLSVLLRPEGILGGGAFNGFFGLVLEAPDEPELFLGKPGTSTDQYVIESRGGPGQQATGVDATVGETALLVLKAEFLTGNDRFSLFVDPEPGDPEPGTADAVKSDIDLDLVEGLTIYSTGAFSIDEIRLGETFADVTPTVAVIPEPASIALAGLGLLTVPAAVAIRRRRS